MATVALAYSNLVPNGELADPAGVATVAGAGNGVQIPAISPNRRQSSPELTILRVANASGSTGTCTVKAGTNPPSLAAGQGDFTTTNILTATTRWIGPFESGRFMQPDGSIIVETSQVMTVTAFKVPRNT
jgi:hypothetical protein